MKIIEVQGLTKIYKAHKSTLKALENVSFSVNKGEFVAITGPSGSGKSTLMNILGCLDRQSFGMYYLKGEDVSRYKGNALAKLRNRSIGFIFQSCDLVSELTAEENVWLPLYYRGVPAKERKALALEALEQVGLSDRANHLPKTLSGGQRQRVAIARAIASKPDVILADEPTGSLDCQSRDEIIGLLKQTVANGNTVIAITHDLTLANSAQRMLTIRDGRLHQEG
ncbi:MAG: ABC transporter ATP-binding protein [Clostridia bacterium]|nr:ABC transporter ATP-binding protein [Clostridia bacterium]